MIIWLRLAAPALLSGVPFLAAAARAADSTESTIGGERLEERLQLGGLVSLDHTSGLDATDNPEISPAVELSLPGVTAVYAWNASAAGVGIAIVQTEIDGYVSKDYALVPNPDWTRGPLKD